MMKATVIALLCAACGPGSRDGDNFGTADASSGSGSNMGSGSDSGSGSGSAETVFVYAHTDSALYKIDPDSLAITEIGPFVWSNGTDTMTDIAIDKSGQMIGVSFTSVYSIDTTNAHATRKTDNLGGTFNGLSFVPADQLGMTGDDVLVGTRNSDGVVLRIDPATGATMQVGNMGGSYVSSGDLVAVAGFGTVQTVPGANGDTLVRLAPSSFAATTIGSGTGFAEIWGVAYWGSKIFGFTSAGAFITVDPNTGAGTLVTQTNMSWYGAAVTTIAPVIE